MDSTRLCGKVMEDIAGKPMLWHVIERLKHCEKVDQIVVATPSGPSNDVVARLADECGIGCYRGAEEDVLDRYYQAAVKYSASVIVRVCGDCPLIDPRIIDRMIAYYLSSDDKFDYVGVGDPTSCPYGLDTEVFSLGALEKSWNEAMLPSEREHVTPYIWKHPQIFRLASIREIPTLNVKKDYSGLIWAVDNKKDLDMVRTIYHHLYSPDKLFFTRDILALLNEKPEIREINCNSIRREGYYKSLSKDSAH